jgi:hypothetical protein
MTPPLEEPAPPGEATPSPMEQASPKLDLPEPPDPEDVPPAPATQPIRQDDR